MRVAWLLSTVLVLLLTTCVAVSAESLTVHRSADANVGK